MNFTLQNFLLGFLRIKYNPVIQATVPIKLKKVENIAKNIPIEKIGQDIFCLENK